MSARPYGYFLPDYEYQQKADGTYETDADQVDLVHCDKVSYARNLVKWAKMCYESTLRLEGIDLEDTMKCDIVLLDQAMEKYSRDVYGEARLAKRVECLRRRKSIGDDDVERLLKCKDYGIKVDSTKPYVYRQVADLLYWLAVLKPFSARLEREKACVLKERLGIAYEYHNEFVSCSMVMQALNYWGLTLDIHSDVSEFRYFLYDLHYRRLTRSALEFFLCDRVVRLTSLQ